MSRHLPQFTSLLSLRGEYVIKVSTVAKTKLNILYPLMQYLTSNFLSKMVYIDCKQTCANLLLISTT